MLAPESLPLITIITPTFNAASCVAKCITSVMHQTNKGVEHLIMDGQSNDHTIALVQQYQEKYPGQIRWISELDNGIYDAMNKGITLAKGTWLFFLGADDFLYENTVLENVSNTLKITECDMVYGNAWMEKLNSTYDGKFDTEKLLKQNFCHQAVFYKAAVFAKMGLYNVNYKIEADYDFNLRCWLSGVTTMKYIPGIIAFHASGGVSTVQRDAAFVKEYPQITINYTLQGNYSSFIKMNILAIIYRKLLLRYSTKDVLKYVLSGNNLVYKSLAIMWIPLTLLYKKKIFF